MDTSRESRGCQISARAASSFINRACIQAFTVYVVVLVSAGFTLAASRPSFSMTCAAAISRCHDSPQQSQVHVRSARVSRGALYCNVIGQTPVDLSKRLTSTKRISACRALYFRNPRSCPNAASVVDFRRDFQPRCIAFTFRFSTAIAWLSLTTVVDTLCVKSLR